MLADSPIVVFQIQGQRFGLALGNVERVLPALHVTPLPKAPEVVEGVIDVRGELYPVINLRRRFRLPERPIKLSDQLLLVTAKGRKLSLVVDGVMHVELLRANTWVAAESLVPGTRYLAGAIPGEDGMTLIHDLDTCLSLDEEARLNAALSEASGDA